MPIKKIIKEGFTSQNLPRKNKKKAPGTRVAHHPLKKASESRVKYLATCTGRLRRGGRNRIGKREKWPKKSWEEREIGGKSRVEGEKEMKPFRKEGEIGSKK